MCHLAGTLRTTWTSALALAPFVLGVVACGGTDVANDAGFAADSGNTPADSGLVADAGRIADAGFVDGGPPPDAGLADSGTPDSGTPDTGTPDSGQTGCTYPAGAVEPMALNEVITPYSWPSAIDGTGARFDLDLTKVHCNNDEDIDWSPHDVLVFISIPAF